MLDETDLSGNVISEYIYFGGQRIARRDTATGYPNGIFYFYLGDRLGSARVIADWTGNVVNESDYYPYGGERVIANSLTPANTYKFTGHERDAETALDHTENRQYSSNTGPILIEP